ncbi:energy transducer TonB [Mucilaginibacter terrigena]|uniref:Energy transducer TonB n=1 Tax=Mucilaginibacter terrigena TaxID=2492395 RepID=A0A4Q5LRH4_9SPHI|nr:energy transducer TonB [Mucilaginibacter terrigena]RYU92047.1 energy transducer TonB [Mucilaginibacter terrigena]
MLNTKLNLYNPDWIELVFANRNKAYGAFDLRQHYGSNMVKAMLIAFTTIVAAAVMYTYVVGKTPGMIIKEDEHVIDLTQPPVLIKPAKPAEPIKATPPTKPLPAAPTRQFIPMTVTSEPVTTDPPKIDDLIGVDIASKTTEGKGTLSQPVDPAPVSTGGTGTAPVDDKIIYNTGGLEFMPEPVGGAAAWSKFLNRNLRFPAEAQGAGKSGRVTVSFVIEKDGRLSNLVVDKGAGYGMDEEALRVLKLAKPWKPGMQNGQAVRVRYVIPLNFQLSEQ